MITGAHIILYSASPAADRVFLRDVLGLPHVEVGEGWLIFGLPPSEVAVHPSEKNDVHELYLLCENVQDFIEKMGERGISCAEVRNAGWGLLTRVTLPGGGKLGVYEPRHARPKAPSVRTRRKKAKKKTAKRSAPAARKSSTKSSRKPTKSRSKARKRPR
jgi:hypothetical protein